jgi:hypothetical protein
VQIALVVLAAKGLEGAPSVGGTTIWSWQQAVLAAGIARQHARRDLTDTARRSLARAHDELCAAMNASYAVRGSELWSWSHDDGRYRIEPFGLRSGDETESNAAQLWSTIQLVPLCPLSPRPGDRAR